MTRRLVPSLLVLLSLAVGAAAVAGCGGNDAKDILKETFSGDKNVRSGQLDITLGFTGSGGQSASQGPVSLKVKGLFENQGGRRPPKFDLRAAPGAGGQPLSVGAISTGDKGFIKLQNDFYAVPPAVFGRFAQGFQQFRRLGLQPDEWAEGPKVKGEEKIGGVETKHVSAGVDVPKFVDDFVKILQIAGLVPSQQRPQQGITTQQRERLADSIENARVDVWSGKDDGILRKLAVGVDLKAPKGQAATGDVSSGSLTFTETFAQINKAQAITVPANARSFTELEKRIRGLDLGSLGATGGGASTGATGGGANTGGPNTGGANTGGANTGGAGGQTSTAQSYNECITTAAGDVQKAQQCADLLSR